MDKPTCELEFKNVGDVTVARFPHEVMLSGHEIEAVGDQLTRRFATGSHRLLLDFANVRSLSSMMLSKLISLNRTLESAGGRLALCNLQPVIAEIMQVTKLNQILCIYPGEQEALEGVRG